jgi:hypothetical protein
MILEFVEKFNKYREELKAVFALGHPQNYREIVKNVITIIAKDGEYGNTLDPERIHVIDDGEYQGTLLFVIAANGYQPGDYWYVKVNYGSCSGCDTLQGIRDYSGDMPTEEDVEKYVTLALHIVQGLKSMQVPW